MRSYDPTSDVDLPGFTGSLAVYAAGVAAGTTYLALRRGLPDRYRVGDLLLGGVATHKFARLVARGSVTSPVRAPFTEFEGPAGAAEHDEKARGEHGVRHTIGELLTCPFCLGVWIGTTYVGCLTAAPRVARAWAAVFTVTSVSDFLQHGYARVRG